MQSNAIEKDKASPTAQTSPPEGPPSGGPQGGPTRDDPDFGTMQLTQKLTIDLRPDVPVVTNVKLAQSFGA